MASTRVKMLVVVNIGMVGGSVLALFMIPPQTPIRTWAISSIVITIAANVWAFRVTLREKPTKKAPVSAAFWFGMGLLLLDALYSVLHR